MAGTSYFSRAFAKGRPYRISSFASKGRSGNRSHCKAGITSQRKLHSASNRNQASLLCMNSRVSLLETKLYSFPPLNASSSPGLLSSIQACGLHLSVVNASGSSDVTIGESSEASDNTVSSLKDDILLSDAGTADNIELLPFETAQDILTSGAADVPLSSLGLCGYTPVGFIQSVLDFSHLYMGLPWWGSIVAGTIVFRALVFPLMIKGQVNSAKLNAIKPELERLQEKLREVSNLQNPMAKAQTSMELQQLFQKHDCHPVKALLAPLIQLPLFVSFFLALRQMSYLPVESMKTGGFLWFPDLTAADPFYVLPVISAATMLLTIETGAEAGMANPQMNTMKNVFRGMCFVMVPLTYHFPTGIFLYWLTSNTISLLQVALMKIPGMKQYFGIPDIIPPPTDPKVKAGGFLENLKAGYKNAQEAAVIKHTEKMKTKKYESSLGDAYQETFQFNPRLKANEEMFKEATEKRKP